MAAYGALPFPMMHGGSLPDALSACTSALPWKPLSACPEPSDGRCYGQWATLKGFEGQRLIRSELCEMNGRSLSLSCLSLTLTIYHHVETKICFSFHQLSGSRDKTAHSPAQPAQRGGRAGVLHQSLLSGSSSVSGHVLRLVCVQQE